MGCRCAERGRQIRAAVTAASRGQFRAAGADLSAASRSLAQDAKSGALTQEARRLAATKLALRRR